ncbi:MAG: cadherin repeat domain-containing protein [Bacteroidales bacterium]
MAGKSMWGWLVCGMAFLLISCEENVNAPTLEDMEFVLEENTPAGTIIGVVAGYDMDPGQNLTYGFTAGNEEGCFALDAGGGHLSVADPTFLDYERHPDMVLEVTATDDHPKPKKTTALVTIHLKDVNEYAPVCEDQVFSLEEDPAEGDTVGTVLAHDPEPQQALLFRISAGNDLEGFRMDQQTGVLTVADPEPLRYDQHPSISLTVEVRDVHIHSRATTAVVRVDLLPASELPQTRNP